MRVLSNAIVSFTLAAALLLALACLAVPR